MQARARAAEETRVRILEATLSLSRERFYDEITLQEIAGIAGVSLQTVIRRFGSKEGLLRAVGEYVTPAIEAMRVAVPPGDIDGVVRALIPHYEQDGDATTRLLAVEDRIPAVKEALRYGKEFHRGWIVRTFAGALPEPDAPDYPRRLALLVAATDVTTWKLLRRDQGLSEAETARAMREMLERLTRSD
ncbi:MAG TPA: TetR/AcrR family transcriptional regulator [Longimicrobiaceae bacterium]|nr:TetR/AcrR family transcriptional regulator [Longimicrobiaceae bacterium]